VLVKSTYFAASTVCKILLRDNSQSLIICAKFTVGNRFFANKSVD
jgi:hypothetical protein